MYLVVDHGNLYSTTTLTGKDIYPFTYLYKVSSQVSSKKPMTLSPGPPFRLLPEPLALSSWIMSVRTTTALTGNRVWVARIWGWASIVVPTLLMKALLCP